MNALRLRISRLPLRNFSSTAMAAKKPAAPAEQEKDPQATMPNAGVTYGSSGTTGKGAFGSREGAMEDQWAYKHDKELIEKMLARMKEMEKALKEKGIDLPEQK